MKASLALAAALVLMTSAPQFKAGVDAVIVDVLVTDGRNAVTGLTAADFELRDNDVVQRVESVFVETVPLSLILTLDASSSVAGTPLTHLKEAASDVVRTLRPDDEGALLTFSGGLTLLTPWTSNPATLHRAIGSVSASGATSLHDAVFTALMLRDGRPRRCLLLLFSDGADTSSWLPGANVLEAARRSDCVAYAVTLQPPDTVVPVKLETPFGSTVEHQLEPVNGYRLDFRSGLQADLPHVPTVTLLEPFVDALAAETGGKVLQAEHTEQLRETFLRIVTEFRTRYVLTYSPSGVAKDGWHTLSVRLKGKRGKVTARRGYLR
jgi:VWFA-related protein